MELEKQYCIYCRRELRRNVKRKNQWHVNCHRSVHGKSSDVFFQGEIVFKTEYFFLSTLEKEISDSSKEFKLIKLTNIVHMFANCGYVIRNKAIIGLDLKFQVQTSFYNLKHLEALYLTQYKFIDPRISRLKNLRVLSLKHCRILDLPEAIGKLTKLETLDISGISGLTRLPEAIGNLKNLTMLKIAPINELVKIKILPKGVTRLQKLELFYLSGTDIKELPNGFGNLENLQASLSR